MAEDRCVRVNAHKPVEETDDSALCYRLGSLLDSCEAMANRDNARPRYQHIQMCLIQALAHRMRADSSNEARLNREAKIWIVLVRNSLSEFDPDGELRSGYTSIPPH
jgi:hypothetical protein